MATHIHRDPDHIPHDVIGKLALSIVFIALITGGIWMMFGTLPAIALLAVVGIWRIATLSRRAEDERIEEDRKPPRSVYKDEVIDPHDRQIS